MSIKWKLAQKLELKWWRNYLRKQPIDVYLQNKRAYWQRVLGSIQLELREEDHVLDAGCGPAGIFLILDKQKVVAIDPLLNQYGQQLDHFKAAWYPHVDFQSHKLEDLVVDKSFDYIFCLNVINHVEDLDLVLDRFKAVLMPKGKMIFSVDSHRFSLLKRIFQLIPGDVLHPHQFSWEDYKIKLKRRGFQIEQEKRLKRKGIFDYWILVARSSGPK